MGKGWKKRGEGRANSKKTNYSLFPVPISGKTTKTKTKQNLFFQGTERYQLFSLCFSFWYNLWERLILENVNSRNTDLDILELLER